MVVDQEQSNGRSPSGGAYWHCVSPVSQAARKALLPLLHWAGALFPPRTLSSHTCGGWEAGEESSQFSLLGHSHCCFIHGDGQYPFSTWQVRAKPVSPKAWFDRSAEVPWHWAATKSISPTETIFNPPLLVSDPTVMWSQGESFCLADLVDI